MLVTTVDDRCRPFFRHVFDDFEVFDFLDGPRGAREALGGRFGRVLGGLEGVRGASWEALGRSWSGLGGRLAARRFLIDFWIDFGVVLGAQKGAKREPKWDQNRTKIEGKNDVEKRCFSRPSWSRLGAILGHFGGHLGVRKSIFVLEKPIREQNSRFS